jgi:outer membrane receptor protein involved in Fe transport
VALSVKPTVESPFLFRLFYKQVFRMPTFNELYYNFIGNSNLRPEYSRQYNVGASFSKKTTGFINSVNLSADAYYNSVDDKILAIPNKNLFVWTMVNLGKVSITGVDFTGELKGRFSEKTRWSGRLAYTWQHAIDITDPSASNYKNRIPYTPDHSGSALLALYVSKWSGGYSLLFSGTRYTLGENNPINELDGFGVHDLFLARDFMLKSVKMNIKLEANNISNEQYEMVRYYPMPGRSFKISFIITNI